MKKYALAAAMTALAGAAAAQSSVNLFVLIDLNVSQYKAGGKAGGTTQTLMNDGTTNGLNGSRWGLRGTEDLGGGLKAGVWLESGVLADTGALGQGGRGFGRQAFVSLSSATAGELRLGRQYILSDSVLFQGDPFGNAMVFNPTTSVTNMGKNLPMFLNAPRADNVVNYQSPALGPIALAAQVGAGEATFDRFHGVRAVYASGPAYFGITYEWNKSRVTGANTNKSLSAAANYNFGSFKLVGALQRNKDLTTTSGNGAAVGVSNLTVTGDTTFTLKDNDGWEIGFELPVGALTWAANYTRMNFDGTAGQSASLGKAAFGARYGLSKNTFLYSGVSLATGGLKDYITQKRVVQAGVRTSF